MAYSQAKHNVFTDRVQDWMGSFQNLRDEASRIDEIYTNETSSGADAAFVTTSNATKQEHIDAIVFMRAFVDFTEGGVVSTLDRRSNITAFTQGR